MKIDGACHCGAITYEAELDPARFGLCHCNDCQSLSASAYRTIAIVDASTFRILSGTPKEYVKTAESGNRRAQAFCAECGSGLYATNADGDRPVFNLRTGTIRQRAELTPAFEVWRESALPWVAPVSPTKVFDKGAG